MNITELIAALDAVRAEHGDLPVLSVKYGDYKLPVLEVIEPNWEWSYEPWATGEHRYYLCVEGGDASYETGITE